MSSSMQILWALNLVYVLNLVWFWKHLSGFNAHTNDSELKDAAYVCFGLTVLLMIRIWYWWQIEKLRPAPRKFLLMLRIVGLLMLLGVTIIFIMLLMA